jgi:hypothetical protein
MSAVATSGKSLVVPYTTSGGRHLLLLSQSQAGKWSGFGSSMEKMLQQGGGVEQTKMLATKYVKSLLEPVWARVNAALQYQTNQVVKEGLDRPYKEIAVRHLARDYIAISVMKEAAKLLPPKAAASLLSQIEELAAKWPFLTYTDKDLKLATPVPKEALDIHQHYVRKYGAIYNKCVDGLTNWIADKNPEHLAAICATLLATNAAAKVRKHAMVANTSGLLLDQIIGDESLGSLSGRLNLAAVPRSSGIHLVKMPESEMIAAIKQFRQRYYAKTGKAAGHSNNFSGPVLSGPIDLGLFRLDDAGDLGEEIEGILLKN